MSATTAYASAPEADASFLNPYSNHCCKDLTANTPFQFNFTQTGLKPGLYDFFLSDVSAALDTTMKLTLIHQAEDVNAAALQAAHTPATNGSVNLMRVLPASAWGSILIPNEFPKLSAMLIGVNGTLNFVKRYPGS